MTDWKNWSYGRNRMRSVLENITETPKEPKKWYHYICCCIKRKTMSEEDECVPYKEFNEDNNNN